MHPAPLSALWRDGEDLHQNTLRIARRVSALTIPHIVPPDGHQEGEEFLDPYSSIGGRGLNNLSSKLLLTLFPPQASPFIYEVDKAALIEQFPDEAGAPDAEIRAKLELAERERVVNKYWSTSGFRPVMYETIRHLLVAGVSVFKLYRDGTAPRLFKLPQTQVRRDGQGNWDRVIIREMVYVRDLKPEVVALLPPNSNRDPSDKVDLWTCVKDVSNSDDPMYKGIKWYVWQEIEDGVVLEHTVEKFKNDADCPWVVVGSGAVAGEHYGRAICAEFLGDLRSVEGLAQAIVEGAAIASQVRMLVDPGAGVTPRELALSANGAYLKGRNGGVEAVSLNKGADFGVANTVMNSIEQRLQLAFLMNTAVRRDAERVTAAEIRFIAEELESSQGGLFSGMADQIQNPVVLKTDAILVRRKDLTALPKGLASPKIVSGLDAIGRGQDRARLRTFAQDAQAVIGVEQFAAIVNTPAWMAELALADGLDPTTLIKSEEQRAAEAQAAQQQQTAESLGPNAIQAVSQALSSGNVDPQAIMAQLAQLQQR